MIYRDDYKTEKYRTCAVSGHREILEEIDTENLKNVFLSLINDGHDTFLIGMAVGFDALCFSILEDLRKENKIKLIACIPCLNQAESFTDIQFKEYLRMLKSADERVLISEDYTPYCMQKRNEYMVEKSSVLVVYLKEETGGTFNTVKFAKRKFVKTIEI